MNKASLAIAMLLTISGAAKAEDIALRCTISGGVSYEFEINDNRIVMDGKRLENAQNIAITGNYIS